MDKMMFNQVIPRLRVLETRLLDKSKLDRMVEADTPSDALKVLQESEYSIHLNNVKRPEDYEVMLSEELKRVYDMFYQMIPEKSVVDFMSLKYDYHNLKVIIKGKILGVDLSNLLIPVGSVEVSKLKYYIESEYYRDLNPIMRKAIERTMEDYASSSDPQKIDIILDRYLFEQMNQLVKNIDDKSMEKYLKTLIDLTNIKTLLRVKSQNKGRDFLNEALISGGNLDNDRLNTLYADSVENLPGRLSFTDYESTLRTGIEEYLRTGSLGALEKNMDNFIINFMKRAKYITFGIEPVLAYLYAKENEIKLIRIIMVGKLNNVPPEVIRERLRDNYA